MFKLTALGSFIIKGTRLLSFILTAFGSITKGTETQHLCLQFLIQYSQGEDPWINPQQLLDLKETSNGVRIKRLFFFLSHGSIVNSFLKPWNSRP